MQDKIKKDWLIKQERYVAEREDYYESIFSLGNGYMGVRGFLEEQQNIKSSETCTYIAGIYDYLKSDITDMVNTPNFSSTKLIINGEELNYREDNIIDFVRILDLKEGSLCKSFVWKDKKGFQTKIETIKFLSIDRVYNAAIRHKITPLNYSGKLVFETAIDATITNNPISDDQLKENTDYVDFLKEIDKGTLGGDISYITLKTKGTQYQICEAFSLLTFLEEQEIKGDKIFIETEKYIAQKIEINVQQDKSYIFDKMVAVVTSRDKFRVGIKEAVQNCVFEAVELGFDGLYKLNKKAWEAKWDISDIEIDGDEKAQLGIRYNIFQLIQGNAEKDPNVSIGARSIFHGRYKGCYFWDTEIFMFPFYAYTNPNAAKNLLMYRYNTLPGAEENARRLSAEGAKFAWMCTTSGLEQCETWDTGCCEIHINADVAFAIDQYWRVTGDIGFIKEYGAEIYIKTARYWRSRFTYNQEKKCYNMLFVKGPDEYCGVTENNTYTTIMAINNMKLAIEAIDMLKSQYSADWLKLKEKTGFSDVEVDLWKDIADKAVINYDAEKHLYIEDDNFLKLEPLNIEKYKTDYTPLYHKISFDRLQRYMVLKQADVILLMSLLPEMFTDMEKRAAWDFYEPITLHDSTLSYGTHAMFAARLGLKQKAYEYFYKSLRLDLDDIMHNTGKEGLHFASFGATWQALINGFAGIELAEDCIKITPDLPETWQALRFKLLFKGSLINVSILDGKTKVTTNNSNDNGNIIIKVHNKT